MSTTRQHPPGDLGPEPDGIAPDASGDASATAEGVTEVPAGARAASATGAPAPSAPPAPLSSAPAPGDPVAAPTDAAGVVDAVASGDLLAGGDAVASSAGAAFAPVADAGTHLADAPVADAGTHLADAPVRGAHPTASGGAGGSQGSFGVPSAGAAGGPAAAPRVSGMPGVPDASDVSEASSGTSTDTGTNTSTDKAADTLAAAEAAGQLRSLELNGASGIVPLARDFTRQALYDWGWLPASTADRRAAAEDVLLVVSELVTNACLHAEGPESLRVASDGKVLRLEVTDRSGGEPTPRTPHRAGRPGGHGMFIVQRLCLDWGVSRAPEGVPGKTVWAELAAPA